jgi:hypothetical protein
VFLPQAVPAQVQGPGQLAWECLSLMGRSGHSFPSMSTSSYQAHLEAALTLGLHSLSTVLCSWGLSSCCLYQEGLVSLCLTAGSLQEECLFFNKSRCKNQNT